MTPATRTDRRLNLERRIHGATETLLEHVKHDRLGLAEDNARYIAWMLAKARVLRRQGDL